jgi:hypothetical protein
MPISWLREMLKVLTADHPSLASSPLGCDLVMSLRGLHMTNRQNDHHPNRSGPRTATITLLPLLLNTETTQHMRLMSHDMLPHHNLCRCRLSTALLLPLRSIHILRENKELLNNSSSSQFLVDRLRMGHIKPRNLPGGEI